MALESVLVTWAAGTTGAPAGVASAVALDFLLFFPVEAVVAGASGAVLSAGAAFIALPSAGSSVLVLLLLDFDFFVVAAVVSLPAELSEAVVLSAAAVLSASAASFLVFFLDFLDVVSEVVVSELVALVLACALTNTGAIATTSITEKASIHRVSLLWEFFIFSSSRFERH